MSRDDNYTAVLLEDIQSQIQRLAEATGAFTDLPRQVTKLTEDMTEVKSDIKVIKSVVTDQSHHLHNHERRITALEAA